jgi:hypothetical protein
VRNSVERYLPVVYFVLSVVLIAGLLPTALRPPQPPPPTSAEFSPDAPPDEDHEVILSVLSRGTTTTAGSGEEVGVGEGPGAVMQEVVELAPRRGLCFGDPPRQAESIYAPACAPAWTGQNPGATWQGVTGDEVRIAVCSTWLHLPQWTFIFACYNERRGAALYRGGSVSPLFNLLE